MPSSIFTNALLSISSFFTRAKPSPSPSPDPRRLSPATSDGSIAVASSSSSSDVEALSLSPATSDGSTAVASSRSPSPIDARPLSPPTSVGSTAVARSKSSLRSASTAVDSGIKGLALGEEMSRGPYGTRFRARDLTNSRSEVCVEKIAQRGLSKTLRNLLMQEIRVSSPIGRGARIPGGIIRAFEDDGHHYIVRRPFVRTLAEEINNIGRFTAQQSVAVLAQMVTILDKLHAHHIYPADLSPTAFVIDHRGLLSLGHLFGAHDTMAPSYVGFKDVLKSSAVYELGNAAPEVIVGGTRPNRSTVVFGIASCWHLVVFGMTRYDPATGKGQILKDLKERTRYSTSTYPRGWNSQWEERTYEFMDRAMLFDSTRRIRLDALNSLPILSNVDWKTLRVSPVPLRSLHVKDVRSRSSPYHPFPSGKVPSASTSHPRKADHYDNARGGRSSTPRVSQPSRSMYVPVRAVRA